MAQQLLTKANKVSDGSNLLSVLNLLKHCVLLGKWTCDMGVKDPGRAYGF